MFMIEPSRLREILDQLHQASVDHAAWHDELLGNLLCHAPGDPRVAPPSDATQCSFGHWYHEDAPQELRDQPAFNAIDQEHRQLHELADRLAETIRRGEPVDRRDYARLTASESRLRLELDALRHELQAAFGHRDPVTGAYERDMLLPELQEWAELARRGVQSSCLLFLDVDHFKQVNDRFGHLIGDRILAGAAACIAWQLRPYDKLFRYGGDEFVILLPAIGLAGARKVAGRIRQRVAATPLVASADGEVISVTVSCGLAMLDPVAGIDESLDRADTALLTAKSSGRNRVVVWDPSVETHRGLRVLDALRDTG